MRIRIILNDIWIVFQQEDKNECIPTTVQYFMLDPDPFNLIPVRIQIQPLYLYGSGFLEILRTRQIRIC